MCIVYSRSSNKSTPHFQSEMQVKLGSSIGPVFPPSSYYVLYYTVDHLTSQPLIVCIQSLTPPIIDCILCTYLKGAHNELCIIISLIFG